MALSTIISGQPVIIQDCISSLNNLGTDCIINSHIWWQDIYLGTPYKLHYDAIIGNMNVVDDFLRSYRVAKYRVEDYPDFDLRFFRKFNYDTWGNLGLEYYRLFTPIILYGLLCQTAAVQKACELCCEDNVDIVIKSRPDILLTKNIPDILANLKIEKNTIYFQSSMDGGHKFCGEHPQKPCDWFFLGCKDAMKLFCDNWHSNIKLLYADGVIHANLSIQKICQISGLHFKLHDFGAYVHKQITNWHYERLIHYSKYIDSFDFSTCSVRDDKIWPHWYKKVDFAHFKNME